MDDMPAILRSAYADARDRATAGTEHLRLPGVLASPWVGITCAMGYAVEVGALEGVEAEKVQAQCWDTLLQLGQQQTRIIEGERPSRRFLIVLTAILSQGRAFLLRRDGRPDDYFGNGAIVGWQDEDFVYLIPDAAFQAVARFCRDSGEFFPVRSERLFRDLNREGLSECNEGRNTTTVRLGGQVRRVVKVRRADAEALLGEALPGAATDVTTVTGLEG